MGTGLLQPTHLIFLLILALLLFGAKRLPEIGRSLGVGMREFKDSVTGVQEATKIDTPAPSCRRRSRPAGRAELRCRSGRRSGSAKLLRQRRLRRPRRRA